MTTSTTQPEIFSRDHTLSEEEDTPDIGIEDMQSEEHESEEGFEEEPPYSAQELGEMFTDFYRFLATLHYDPQNLKVPPPEGWNITDLPPSVVEKKSELMVKVMRHLPYFSNARKSTQVDLQCILIDYIDAEQHERAAYHQEIAFDGLGADGFSVQDEAHLLLVAWGYESCGCNLILDISEGVVIEDIIRVAMYPSIDVREYFKRQKEKYRSLEILVCPGREVWLATTSKAHEVSAREERGGPITEKEVRAQEEDWGTELDELFVKQMWRQYGWPEAFRREEAVEAMEAFMAFHTKETIWVARSSSVIVKEVASAWRYLDRCHRGWKRCLSGRISTKPTLAHYCMKRFAVPDRSAFKLAVKLKHWMDRKIHDGMH